MVHFTIKLADIAIGISAMYPQIKSFCRDYLTDEKPAFTLQTTPENIAFEREQSALTDIREGRAPIHYPDAYLETLAVYRKIAEGMLDYHTLLFHGSVIAVDGAAYLFTAVSGTGKSTHTRLWRELLGDRAYMVNDDKPLLRITESGILACGTPWDGKHHLSRNVIVPLKAVCILRRGEENHIAPITFADAYPTLYQQCYHPKDAERTIQVLDMLDAMGAQVEFYQLHCNMKPEAALVSWTGMGGTL